MAFDYLHSINPLCGWLALGAPDILISLMNKSVSEWTIGHRMFVHVIILEVGHHISKSCLSSWFGPLFLYFVHLFQVLFGSWIKLWTKSFLCLKRASFRFGHLIDLESTSHCWVHHYLAWSLYLLKAIECDIVEIACTIQISLLISHNLLEEAVTSSLPLFLLEE